MIDRTLTILVFITILALNFIPITHFAYAQQETPRISSGSGTPNIIKDPNLKVELISEGLELPTSMAFLGPNDILVLEKDKGTVQRIVNGTILAEPLLDVNVANKSERGMLGIAVASAKNNENEPTYVFLYYTESVQDGNDDCPSDNFCNPGNDPLGNRLYRYELVNDKLVNPKLMLDLPATPGPAHNGGAVTIGPDNNVYLVMGELRNQSIQKVSSADGRGGILTVTQDGKVSGEGGKGILGNTYPLNFYYAYGIRNSFGIDFDPVTGKLWDTENGQKSGDEINLVEPGFNSGWNEIQGMWTSEGGGGGDKSSTDTENVILNPDNLLDFGGKAKYSNPEFTWGDSIGPTALKFFNSDKLGKQYQNDIFVGDVNNGNLYHFKLDKQRTGLLFLEESLSDKVADKDEENEGIIFGEGFGSISDLEVGPDGYLYILSIGQGAIYRIVSSGGGNNSDIIAQQSIITDPTSPDDTIKIPAGIEFTQGDKLKSIEPSNNNNNESKSKIKEVCNDEKDNDLDGIIDEGYECILQTLDMRASNEQGVPELGSLDDKDKDEEKGIEDKQNKNIKDEENDDVSICNKLKSYDKALSDTWIERKITDEQVRYLGVQVNDLMVEAGCIN
jgi:aldose sugar dehydrogenase